MTDDALTRALHRAGARWAHSSRKYHQAGALTPAYHVLDAADTPRAFPSATALRAWIKAERQRHGAWDSQKSIWGRIGWEIMQGLRPNPDRES